MRRAVRRLTPAAKYDKILTFRLHSPTVSPEFLCIVEKENSPKRRSTPCRCEACTLFSKI